MTSEEIRKAQQENLGQRVAIDQQRAELRKQHKALSEKHLVLAAQLQEAIQAMGEADPLAEGVKRQDAKAPGVTITAKGPGAAARKR